EWNAGQVALYDPADESWREWRLPGHNPQPYAVYVAERDIVWLSDFGANALVRFHPATEESTSFPLPHDSGNVRQILGRPGEVWATESGADALVVLRTQRRSAPAPDGRSKVWSRATSPGRGPAARGRTRRGARGPRHPAT